MNYYRNVTVRTATDDQKVTKGKRSKEQKGNFFTKAANSGILKGFEDVGNAFMHNAPNATDNLSGLGQNTMRDGVKNAEKLSGLQQGYAPVQDQTYGVNPDMSFENVMGEALGQVKKPGRKPAKK